MNKLIALGLAVFLGACAAQSGDESSASTDQAATSGPHGLSVESCQGKKECVDALVMRAIFTSDALMTSDLEDATAPRRLVREVIAEWLAKTNDASMSIQVLEGKPGTGTWDVSINLTAGHETKDDEGDVEALILDFSIKGGTMVEPLIQGTYIG